MEKVKRFKNPIIAAVVLLLIILIIAAVYWQSTPQMLYPEQIREYKEKTSHQSRMSMRTPSQAHKTSTNQHTTSRSQDS
jgi:cytoskeletal protein RodZ